MMMSILLEALSKVGTEAGVTVREKMGKQGVKI